MDETNFIIETRHGKFRVTAQGLTINKETGIVTFNKEGYVLKTAEGEAQLYTDTVSYRNWDVLYKEGHEPEQIIEEEEIPTRPEGEAGMLSQGIDFVEVKPIQLSESDVPAIEAALNDSIVAKLVQQGYRIFKAQKGNVQLYKPLPEPVSEKDLAELVLGGLFMPGAPGYPTGYGFHFPEGLVVADEKMLCILCGEPATDIVNTTGGNLSIGSAEEAREYSYCEACADEKHNAMAQERLDADLEDIHTNIADDRTDNTPENGPK